MARKTLKIAIIGLLASFLVGTGNIMAQEVRRDYPWEEIIKRRAQRMTDRMADLYSLDENQQEKLLKVNEEFLFKMVALSASCVEHRPYRHGRHRSRHGCCGYECYEDYCCDERSRHEPLTRKELKYREEYHRQILKERREARSSYHQSLKDIMTEEQYEDYQEYRDF